MKEELIMGRKFINPLATFAAVAALGLSVLGRASSIFRTDSTQSGGTLTVNPTDELVVSGSANPLLTLTNAATTSGVGGLVVGTTQSPYGSKGQLRVEGGSTLSNSGTGSGTGTYGGTNISSGYGYLGLNSGSFGAATVAGSGSTWTNSRYLTVGYYGNGTLNVEDGGRVLNTIGYLGYISGSSGVATVTGSGSAWTNSGNLSVGLFGAGTLNVQDGAGVSNINGRLGNNSGSSGAATVTGSGSTWTNSQNLFIGYSGTGTLSIGDGGAVAVTGTAYVGNAASRINLADGGMLKAQSLNLGGAMSRLHWTGGTLELTGGSTDTGLSVSVGGTLAGIGTVGGDLTSAGTISPGNSPGLLSITGDLTQDAVGELLIELAGTTRGSEYDALDLTGDFNAGGTLHVVLLDDFAPQLNDRFNLLDFASFTGDFATLDLPSLNGGLAWDTTALGTDGTLSVVAAPEPGSVGLLGLGGLALLGRRWRKFGGMEKTI
jgi:T5SS/PEP-CTERM-associated repeat protein